MFADYRLRVGEIVADTAPPRGLSLEQRLDETEVGAAKFVTLTEVQAEPVDYGTLNADLLLNLTGFNTDHVGLVGHDVFSSITNKGKLALLASWRDRRTAESFVPPIFPGVNIRHRVVRVVRDYGMFDRRESPQYYPDALRMTLPKKAGSVP